MYRLMIVDDERYIVESLSELFSGATNPEFEILTAYFGDDALSLLKSQKVDVVLLDINMPGLSGIEVAEHIAGNWPLCKIIFLTGYANFDHLYQINQMKNTSYLLKTEDNEVIVDAVRQAVREIEEEQNLKQMEIQSQSNHIYLQYLLHAEILTDFLHGKKPYELREEIRNSPNPFLFSLNEPVYLLYMKIKSGRPGGYRLDFHRKIVELTLFLQQSLNEKFRLSLVDIDSNTIIAFLQLSFEKRNDLSILPHIYIRECLNDRISLPSALPFQIFLLMLQQEIPWTQIGKTFDQLHYYYTNILLPQFPEYGRIMTIQENDLTVQRSAPDPAQPSFPQGAAQELGLYLHSGNREGIDRCLKTIQDYLCSLKSMHHLNGIRLYQEVSNLFIEYLTQYHLEEKAALQIGLYRLYNLDQFGSWSELIPYYHRLTDVILELTRDETFNIKEQTLTQIKRYIHENLGRNLTLNEIANSVNYNSSYVSRYFKQMTGQSISQYIVQMKVERAKKYLSSSNDSIQNISEKLGFESPQYFSLVFKKYTGFSPRSYRINAAPEDTEKLPEEN